MEAGPEIFERWDREVCAAVKAAAQHGPFDREGDLEFALYHHARLAPEGCERAGATGNDDCPIGFHWLEPGSGKGMGTPKAPDLTSLLRTGESWGTMIEVKVGNHVDQCVWDLFKLVNLVEGGQGLRGYLCVQAPSTAWSSGSIGTELFQPVDADLDRRSSVLVGAEPHSKTRDETRVRRKNWIKYLSWASAGYPLLVPEEWDCHLIDGCDPIRFDSGEELRVAVIERPAKSMDSSERWFPKIPIKNPDRLLDYRDYDGS